MVLHRWLIMISDLHVADKDDKTGLDKFDSDADFERLLLEVIPRQTDGPVTLVIAGDFIDFPQVLPEFGQHSLGNQYGSTETQSLLKMKRVTDAHPRVFGALRQFMERGGQVLVLAGNHDVDLYWDSVFAALRSAVGGFDEPQLCFIKGGEIHEQGLHIEHGHQRSFDNRFKHWPRPFVSAPDGSRLERPWGTLFMDLCYNEAEQIYRFLNKVHPRTKLLWSALRSGWLSQPWTKVRVAANVGWFLVRQGAPHTLNWFLGEEKTDGQPSVEAWLAKVDLKLEAPRRAEIAAEILALLEDNARDLPKMSFLGGQPGDGLPEELLFLGETDEEKGLDEFARGLLQARQASVVACGHTHNPFPKRYFGDERWYFNTGSWIPHLPSNIRPKWDELDTYLYVHDIRYLVIELSDPPRARLERL